MSHIDDLNKKARWIMDSPFPITEEQNNVLLRMAAVMDENTLALYEIFLHKQAAQHCVQPPAEEVTTSEA